MKIVLTGATGFLGFRTLERLIEQDEIESIVATGRKIKQSHLVTHAKVEYRLGDLSNVEFLSELLEGATHIVHAAALSSPWGKYADFEKINLTVQKNLIVAARKNNVERMVFISTPSIYFEMIDKFNIKESDPLPKQFINAYSETKYLAELELKDSKIPFVILRPRALIGRGDTVIMPRIIRAYNENRLRIVGDGKNIVDLTSVANVANAIWLSLNVNSKGLNQIYNITNDEPVELWKSISDVLYRLGKIPPTKKIPLKILRLIARIMEQKSKYTNMKEPVLTEYGVGILANTFTMDISKAKNLLNYELTITIEEAIDEFIEWYKENEKN
jgi:nucleoside-diphosphate-sugar epimerase